MTDTRINIVVLSTDIKYKKRLAAGLAKLAGYNVIQHYSNLIIAQTAFRVGQPNVAIIDVENQLVSEPYIKKLMNDYHLLFILVGINRDISFATKLNSLKDQQLYKPTSDSDYLWDIYLKDILKRITAFSNQSTSPGITPSVGVASGFRVNMDFMDAITTNDKIIAIASSTGGTEALPVVLKAMPKNSPPILIVQHMPAKFTKQFADRLDNICSIHVVEASNGDYLKKGVAYIAPGDFHIKLTRRGAKLALETVTTEKINGVRPAADILFASILPIMPAKTIGIILTGMGADGARGLYELHAKGATVIGQSPETCVVYGMPKVAFDIGAVDYQLPLDKIASKVISLV